MKAKKQFLEKASRKYELINIKSFFTLYFTSYFIFIIDIRIITKSKDYILNLK